MCCENGRRVHGRERGKISLHHRGYFGARQCSFPGNVFLSTQDQAEVLRPVCDWARGVSPAFVSLCGFRATPTGAAAAIVTTVTFLAVVKAHLLIVSCREEDGILRLILGVQCRAGYLSAACLSHRWVSFLNGNLGCAVRIRAHPHCGQQARPQCPPETSLGVTPALNDSSHMLQSSRVSLEDFSLRGGGSYPSSLYSESCLPMSHIAVRKRSQHFWQVLFYLSVVYFFCSDTSC